MINMIMLPYHLQLMRLNYVLYMINMILLTILLIRGVSEMISNMGHLSCVDADYDEPKYQL